MIPVLQEINRPRDLTVYEEEGWDTYFYSDVHQQTSDWPCENVDSVALLALKFFKFYYEVGGCLPFKKLCGKKL